MHPALIQQIAAERTAALHAAAGASRRRRTAQDGVRRRRLGRVARRALHPAHA